MSVQSITKRPFGEQIAGASLEDFWHPVAHVSEVGDQPKAFTLLGERLVLLRDAEGVVAFQDLCIHRGVALSLGSVENGRLSCAYHGWTYDRTGACVHIPQLGEGAPIPRKARIVKYQAVEKYDLVWVALNEPKWDIPQWPDGMWEDPSFRSHAILPKVWKANAGRAAENAADLSHLNHVHKDYIPLHDGPVIHRHEVAPTEYGLTSVYQDAGVIWEWQIHAPFTVIAKKTGLPAADPAGSAADGQPVPVMCWAAFHSPIDEHHTRIFYASSRNHSLDMSDADFDGELIQLVFDQDQVIVESQRPEHIPVELREELHLKVPDAIAMGYRQLLGKLSKVGPYLP
ncbi:Rieske 2Fe-2S domain-containing protein [Rhodococcus sp. NPDC057014]|uniref:Rieske 2Fe-2S domain-containing protein n=1 Tax=Rhodococcus sp. NPDC057014 TaxID=3346000 RepID=UPI00362FEA9F